MKKCEPQDDGEMTTNDLTSNDQAWDVRSLLPVVDGDTDELTQLLNLWLRQSNQLLEEMRGASARADGAKLHLAAHTLKGSLQFLDADSHCPAVLELEKAGKRNQFDAVNALLSDVERQLASIRDPIVEFIKSPETRVDVNCRSDHSTGRSS